MSFDLRLTARKVLSEKSSLITSKLDRLKTMYMDVVNGKNKNSMTTEYLKIIREETNKFLSSKGYDHTAVGDNYIEEAPSDIEVVEANAKICHDLLVSANDPTSEFRVFRDEISNKVYGMIDAWIADVELVLSLELNEPIIPKESFIERINDIIESDTTSKNIDVYKDLIQDIMYCHKMKELESEEKTNSLDIVPVSGLIHSRVVRMEKECLTVIDIWGNKMHKIAKAAEKEQQQTSSGGAPQNATPTNDTNIIAATTTAPIEEQKFKKVKEEDYYLPSLVLVQQQPQPKIELENTQSQEQKQDKDKEEQKEDKDKEEPKQEHKEEQKEEQTQEQKEEQKQDKEEQKEEQKQDKEEQNKEEQTQESKQEQTQEQKEEQKQEQPQDQKQEQTQDREEQKQEQPQEQKEEQKQEQKEQSQELDQEK